MNFRKFGIVILLIILIGITGFIVWASFPLGPSDTATKALESTSSVVVTQDKFITFTPTNQTPTTGLIFYPGGRVAEESYAPLAQMIASSGYLVVIVPMPLHLAVFAPNKAEQVIENYPDIVTWTIAGHSLGGSMAASFVYDHPNTISALYLLASYPADSNNLSDRNIEVITIYGTQDMVLSTDIEDTLFLLPNATRVVEIEGGNHAYFGNYGEQPGDGTATISRLQQQNITSTEIISSLNNL